VQHMIKSMAPATAAWPVVLPHGALFRMGKEGEIREKIFKWISRAPGMHRRLRSTKCSQTCSRLDFVFAQAPFLTLARVKDA